MDDDSISRVSRQFDAAVKVIQNLPKDGSFKPSNEMMLKFYAYYKQAKQGKCTAQKPSFWDVVGKAKWEAWHSLGSMSHVEAMQMYVNELKQIIEVMPQTSEVNGLVKELDSFYELVDLRTGETLPPEIEENDSEVLMRNDSISNGHHHDGDESLTNGHDGDESLTNGHDVLSTNGDQSADHHPSNRLVKSLANGVDDGTGSIGNTPDILSSDGRLTLQTTHKEDQLERVSTPDSDTDSEVYLDSSDIIIPPEHHMSTSLVGEKTVDLLASCEPGNASSSSYLTPPSHSGRAMTPSMTSTRPKTSKPHSVTFSLPEGVNESSDSVERDEVNEKLRMALLNMQQEMNSLSKRLSLVEQITVNQRKKQLEQSPAYMRWWPFPGLQPRTVMLLLVWPVFVSWFMRYLAKRRRRS